MPARLILLLVAASLLGVAAWFLHDRSVAAQRDELATLPAELPIAAPSAPIVSLDLCEDLTEAAGQTLHRLGEALRARDRVAAERELSPAFRGVDWGTLHAAPAEALPLGVQRIAFDPATGTVVGASEFLAGVEARLADWKEIEFVALRADRADFQSGTPLWGRLRLTAEFSGRGGDGSARTLVARGFAQVAQAGKQWYLHAFELCELEALQRARRMFTEVTREAGVHVTDPPLSRHQESWNGCAAGDVNGDGMIDLYVPGAQANRLYVARAEGGFRDEAAARGVQSPAGGTGTLFFDYDRDGDQDLLVADESGVDRDGTPHGNELRLLRNDGERFADVSRETGLAQRRYSFNVTVLDYDLDGWLDVFVGNYGRQTDQHNNRWVGADNGQSNQLFHNLEGQRFEDVSERTGTGDKSWTYASAAADYDRDGDTDLYVVNDFGLNQLLRNEGDGTFRDVTDDVLRDPGFGMSATWCDLDNDGALDLYVANMWSEVSERVLARLTLRGADVDLVRKFGRGNSLLLGRADGGFRLAPVEYGATEGRWAWASPALDVDLDGRLDLFCTNGFMTGAQPGDALTWYWRNIVAASIAAEDEPSILVRQEVSDRALNKNLKDTIWKQNKSYSGRERDKLWINRGSGGFWDVSSLSGADLLDDGRAAVVADFDDDGDPDLFVNSIQLGRHHLLRNDVPEPAGRFLKVALQATHGHPQAVGAEVRVHGPAGPCSQVVAIGSQYLSCQPTELLFGLGDAPTVRVEVFWPGGRREEFGAVRAGQRVRLVEGSGAPEYLPLRPRPLTP